MSTGDLVTADEVAANLKVKPETVVMWARQGRIPCVRFSRKMIRFRLSDVIEALSPVEEPAAD